MSPDSAGLTFVESNLAIAAIALLIERLLGYPNGLQHWIGHPVEWMGKLIGWLDRFFNDPPTDRLRGTQALLVLLGITISITLLLTHFLRSTESGWIFEALLASTLLSQKSLEDHVRAVADGLSKSLKAGRDAVRHIVGRDPQKLDTSGVATGAIESLAENMSDGVTAPLFWLLIGGLPGIALYKAINTADSMVGHKSERYLEFGWPFARLDDLVNLVPARITGWIIAAAGALTGGASGSAAVRSMARDAPNHVSPNAGWPEAAMAGALGLSLGGPRSYGGRKVDLAWMGNGRKKLTTRDITDALRLYNIGLNVLTAIVILGCVISWTA
ncbi:MAG: adenosylcobinamide-phosphate synthase CbiB [Hyphomicrobiaceae bacterium]|nr:adenosylcobinamide-phosphate synthase CbiB [Hyphomicrobiaceae bacterium]